MLIYWMPYLRLAYPLRGPREQVIGKAVFFDDTPQSWEEVLGCERPARLRIYRDFPPVSEDRAGDSVFGTLIRSDDAEWLKRYVDHAIATLYFVGHDPMRGRPAECFTYQQLSVSPAAEPSPFFGIWNKHGRMIESPDSIALYPPLAARGYSSAYRIDRDKREHSELLRRFAADPLDRIVVAIRQYFRTQFADIFISPFEEDFALHCGAIEAALDIDALSRGTSDRFKDALTELYGDDEGFAEFFLGLYVARSLFVHGVSTGTSNQSQQHALNAFQAFQNTPGKITLMRKLTHDVIVESLGREKDEFGFWRKDSSAYPLLTTVICSCVRWEEAKNLLTQPCAADRIYSMSEEEFDGIEKLAYEMDHYFDWQCVTPQPSEELVRRALQTCAIVLTRLVASGPIFDYAVSLGEATDAPDDVALRQWVEDDLWRDVYLQERDRVSAMQRMSRRVATFFSM